MMSTSDGTELRASLSLALGAAYIIDRELDAGGTARIFVAQEESFGRDVAIVVLDEALTRGMSATRFASELRLATMVDEPHTVPILAVGQTASGQHFYTMPFVRGMSLRERIDHGPVGFDESVAVLRDIARAMAYAHGRGFVHRHLVPDTVILGKSSAVVTDFGLSRALARAGARDPEGLLTHISFTALPYVSPEQAVDDPTTDQRTDIYAWGVMAYELLLDADPFADVSSPAVGATVPVSDISPLQLFKRHGVPEQLALLVMRCCEYDPVARPFSASELVEVLERIPDRASTLALERKSAALWVGASIVAALALFVASGMAVYRMQKRENREPPIIAVLPFESSGAAGDSVIAERLSDAVTTKLSKLPGLRVVDRESVRSILDSNRSARAIGRALGADFVLRTSMRWVLDTNGSPHLRLSPLVVRVSDGTTKWAGRPLIVPPADPFTVQATLATGTANELDVPLGENERAILSAQGTRDTAAFAAFSRGDRLYRKNVSGSSAVYQDALREFERAYGIDARYGDAFGGAALSLVRIGGAVASQALADSARALARHALLLSPGQAHALDAAAAAALMQGRLDDARAWVDQAINTNPSHILALQLRAMLLPIIGDSAGAWRDVERLMELSPRSAISLVVAATSSQTFRRFTDAGEFLQRARLLEPNRIDLILRVAKLARAAGNLQAMTRAVREFRRRGGTLSAADLTLLRVGDDAMRNELAQSPPAAFGVTTPADSIDFYSQKAQLFLARREIPRARGLLDSSIVLLRRMVADTTLPATERRRYVDLMAWTDAALGARVKALAVATGMERDTLSLQWPHGQLAASLACNSAEIYAFVDDVVQMIQELRRCITLPGGYTPSAISAEPALWRHANDPRLRQLLGEFKLEIRRKE